MAKGKRKLKEVLGMTKSKYPPLPSLRPADKKTMINYGLLGREVETV